MPRLLGFCLPLALFFVVLSCQKEPTVQEQLEEAANKEKWTFIPIPGMICRDNSNTGIGVRLKKSSSKVLIYLEGGGGCFNIVTCSANPNNFNKIAFDSWKTVGLQFGIFDKGSARNPFKDWNFIYIPYCTGDVHSGTSYSTDIHFPYNDQKMVGYKNIELALEELKAYFGTGLDEVFLTGSSAGGYGALLNAGQVIDAFPTAQATVLDDSGPVLMDQGVQPDCLDERWERLFQIHLPSDFATYTTQQYPTSIKSIYEYLGAKYPNVQFGLVAPLKDIVIREFYGYGTNDCAEATVVPAPVPADDFKNALIHVRDVVMAPYPNWATFYIDDASHTVNLLPGTMKREVNGTTFGDWLNDLRQRTATHVHD